MTTKTTPRAATGHVGGTTTGTGIYANYIRAQIKSARGTPLCQVEVMEQDVIATAFDFISADSNADPGDRRSDMEDNLSLAVHAMDTCLQVHSCERCADRMKDGTRIHRNVWTAS